MTRNTILLVAALALLGCSGRSNNSQTPGGTQPSVGKPEATPAAPSATGSFAATANVKATYPTRITTAGGATYVSDAVGNQVVGTDSDGNATLVLAGLSKPLGIAVAGDQLYVGNAGRKDVEVYSISQQKYLRTLGGAGAFEMPNAIAVASDGTVFVVDSKKNVVQVYAASGAFVRTIGTAGAANGQFNFPSAVAVDDTRIVVGDQGNHRVQIFDRQGGFQSAFGGEVVGGKSHEDYKGKFTRIAGVALAGDNIYVLDSAHSYVQVLDGTGQFQGFLGSVGDCPTCMKLGVDVTVTADGKVLVTDPENRRFVTLSTVVR